MVCVSFVMELVGMGRAMVASMTAREVAMSEIVTFEDLVDMLEILEVVN